MNRLLGLLVIWVLGLGCAPMHNREGDFNYPDDYLGRERYMTPNGVSPEELDKLLPGTSTGPSRFTIHGGEITFPIHGSAHFTDDWREPRDGHLHQGNDIFAKKMTPIVAIADGYVLWIEDKPTKKCCNIGIGHDDGWQSWYVHLNNDTPGTDDNQLSGIVSTLKLGSTVRKGQVIGWVGDSGNAESTAPHLHFELHYKETPVNPYLILRQVDPN